jgi:hypothetical protein
MSSKCIISLLPYTYLRISLLFSSRYTIISSLVYACVQGWSWPNTPTPRYRIFRGHSRSPLSSRRSRPLAPKKQMFIDQFAGMRSAIQDREVATGEHSAKPCAMAGRLHLDWQLKLHGATRSQWLNGQEHDAQIRTILPAADRKMTIPYPSHRRSISPIERNPWICRVGCHSQLPHRVLGAS